jgi:defect-in-organelle-trafficking protein DotB
MMNNEKLKELEAKYRIKPRASTLKAEDFKDIIREVEARGGFSDIYFSAYMPIKIKVNGFVVRVTERSLTDSEAKEVCILVGGDGCIGRLNSGADFDPSYQLPITEGVYTCYRYRCNLTRGINEHGRGYHAVLRSLKTKIPPLDFVGISKEMFSDMIARQGLGILAGTTASGKSTTIASTLQHQIDHGDPCVILTYESPIEYILESENSPNCIAIQTEIADYGGDLTSMDKGVRNSLRRNGDIVLIGETRDAVTADATITAAMTGQFCLTTMHTNSVAETVDRFLSFYSDPSVIRQKTAEFFNQIRWIMCQALVKSSSSTKNIVLVREYMFFSKEDRLKLLAYSGNDRKTYIEEMIKTSPKGQLMSDHAKKLLDLGDIDDYTYQYIISGIS